MEEILPYDMTRVGERAAHWRKRMSGRLGGLRMIERTKFEEPLLGGGVGSDQDYGKEAKG